MINRLIKHFKKVFKISTKEEVLEAVRKDGWALKYASKKLKRDREVVMEAVQQREIAVLFVSKELRREILMQKALKQDVVGLTVGLRQMKRIKNDK